MNAVMNGQAPAMVGALEALVDADERGGPIRKHFIAALAALAAARGETE